MEEIEKVIALKDYYESIYHTACNFIAKHGLWDEFYDEHVIGFDDEMD